MNEIATAAAALRTLLANNIVSFTFRKVNGEIRHAKGTRNLDLARNTTGEYIPTPKGEEQPNSYYDVEKMGWRSYKPENLISIDGVYDASGFYAKVHPTKKGELPKREIPVQKPVSGGIDIGSLFGGIFGGVGFGDSDFGGGIPKEEIRKAIEKLDKDIVIGAPAHSPKIGTPVATDKGLELPLGDVSVDAFARLVARYVVDELINRLK